MHRLKALKARSAIPWLALVLLTSGEVRADLIYNLRFDQSSYFVAPGSTIDVGLILEEVATTPDTNVITDTNGVVTGNVKVGWTGGGSAVVATSDATNGVGFTDAGKTLTASDITLQQLSITGVSGTQVTGPPGIRVVGMATLTFTAPNIIGDVTTISFLDPNPGAFADLVLLDTTSLDGLVNFGSAAVTTTPEPGSLTLMFVAATTTLCGYRMRKRRAKSQTGRT